MSPVVFAAVIMLSVLTPMGILMLLCNAQDKAYRGSFEDALDAAGKLDRMP